ncbi:hypothetical protein LMIY3S_04514 [Labrys miyagiensis]
MAPEYTTTARFRVRERARPEHLLVEGVGQNFLVAFREGDPQRRSLLVRQLEAFAFGRRAERGSKTLAQKCVRQTSNMTRMGIIEPLQGDSFELVHSAPARGEFRRLIGGVASLSDRVLLGGLDWALSVLKLGKFDPKRGPDAFDWESVDATIGHFRQKREDWIAMKGGIPVPTENETGPGIRAGAH